MSTHTLEVSSLVVGTALRLERNAWQKVKWQHREYSLSPLPTVAVVSVTIANSGNSSAATKPKKGLALSNYNAWQDSRMYIIMSAKVCGGRKKVPVAPSSGRTRGRALPQNRPSRSPPPPPLLPS